MNLTPDPDRRLYLLPLTDAELFPVLSALVHYATWCEAGPDGDVLGHVPLSDRVAGRLRQLAGLSTQPEELWAAAAGLGRYRRRPQG